MKLEFFGVQTSLITSEDEDITEIIIKSLLNNNLELQDKDIIVIASKIISFTEGCQYKLANITEVRKEAQVMAKAAELDPRFVEVVFKESEEIFGAVPGAVLTLRDNVLQANAGVDQSNAGGEDFLIVLPRDPIDTAEKIYREIVDRTKKKVGIIISDSKTHPLRRGTSGFALAVAGFVPIIDDRGTTDIFGRPMRITTRAIADNLACGAEILMGESNQKVPIVLVRGCKEINFQEVEDIEKNNLLMKMSPPQHCIYMGPLWYKRV
ncbi:MAG: coenzyme F420-0:L-glutamate ligase [Candidatus Hodarchaeota archaeon]